MPSGIRIPDWMLLGILIVSDAFSILIPIGSTQISEAQPQGCAFAFTAAGPPP